jgi:hypothetical protein
LRVFILAGHSRAEVNSLIAPSQVMSGQLESRSHDHHSAMLACVFLVLFILVLGAITLALTVTGSPVKGSLAPHICRIHQHGTAFAEWRWLSDTGHGTPNRGKIDFGGGNGSGPA